MLWCCYTWNSNSKSNYNYVRMYLKTLADVQCFCWLLSDEASAHLHIKLHCTKFLIPKVQLLTRIGHSIGCGKAPEIRQRLRVHDLTSPASCHGVIIPAYTRTVLLLRERVHTTYSATSGVHGLGRDSWAVDASTSSYNTLKFRYLDQRLTQLWG